MGNKTNRKFDERQQQVRGKVFTFAWFYTLCFFGVNAIIFEIGYEWSSLANLVYLGALSSSLISGTILIIKDAYSYIYGCKIMNLISICISAIAFSIVIINDLIKDGFISNGKITTGSCFLIVLPLIFLDMILIFIDYKKDKKENKKSCK